MAVAGKIWTHARADIEATRGAGGTPDLKVIFDELTHEQSIDTIYPTRLSGSYEDHYDAVAGTQTNRIVATGLVDFNQMILWGNVFFKGLTTGVGAGADKTYAFLPNATTDDLKTLMMQVGMTDSLSATQPGWQIPYLVGQEFKLGYSKAPGSPGITFSSTLISPASATDITAFTGAAPEPTLQLASHINTQVTIDSSTLGSTVDNFVTTIDFTLTNNWVSLYSLNNTANAQDTFRPNAVSWNAVITRYWANDTEYEAWKIKTPRKIRIRTLGAVLGASNYKIDLELYGVYTGRTWTEVDGLRMEQLTLSPRYDTTAATSKNLTVVGSLATI
jgi:hypothetical protein